MHKPKEWTDSFKKSRKEEKGNTYKNQESTKHNKAQQITNNISKSAKQPYQTNCNKARQDNTQSNINQQKKSNNGNNGKSATSKFNKH